MQAEFLNLLVLFLLLSNPNQWRRYRPVRSSFLVLVGLILTATGTVTAQPTQTDTFDERDTRVFKAVACTKDSKPVEALYYVVASRSDLSAGKPSPSAQLMKDEVESNWRAIASQLTMEQVIEEMEAKL